jgi:hypothetical protein
MTQKYKRRKILINPRLQLLSALVFMSTASTYVLVQAILLNRLVTTSLQQYQGHDPELLDTLLSGIVGNLALTFLLLVPVSLLCATMLTFRFAGPIYRFETYLQQFLTGEDPGPCHVRKEDEFKDIAALLTQLRDMAQERGFFRAPEAREQELVQPESFYARARERAPV